MRVINSGDLNDIRPSKVSSYEVILVNAECTNKPSGSLAGYMHVYSWTDFNYVVQEYVDADNGKIYTRKYANPSWSNWVEK